MNVVAPDDIEAALWEKFLFVTPLGGVGAVARAPVGVLREIPETRCMLRFAMEEIIAIARKRNVALGDDAPDRALELIDGLPAEATASMQRDVMAGEPSELEYQTGTVVRYGEESGGTDSSEFRDLLRAVALRIAGEWQTRFLIANVGAVSARKAAHAAAYFWAVFWLSSIPKPGRSETVM